MSSASSPPRRKTGGSPLSTQAPGPRGAGSRRSPAEGGEGPKLVCLSGPSAGEEFPLWEGEMVVGRATENAISIPDTSVSRRHASLRQVGEEWVCADLGSGNGTLINGERISEETPLRGGDLITLGDTELSFVVAGGPER